LSTASMIALCEAESRPLKATSQAPGVMARGASREQAEAAAEALLLWVLADCLE
jgi:hypothetical protein